jgi:hypothetical protein
METAVNRTVRPEFAALLTTHPAQAACKRASLNFQ